MSKILIATNHSYMLYQFRRELIAKLAESNDIVLSMPFVGREDDFKALGYKCINIDIDRRGINPLTDIKLIFQYIKLLKSEKPDKVITYSIKPNIYLGSVCKLMKVPYYANVQGLGTAFQSKKLAAVVTFMYKFALSKAKTVFFENTANAKVFTDRKILPESKIKILNGAGVNLEYYSYSDIEKSDVTKFLFIGRIMKEKGVDELFSAFTKLKSEFGDKVSLDIVGFFEDEYKETVENLSAKRIINFYGFQTDARPFYKNADCVVLPSYHEGLSNVLLEAAATGRPVITSDIPGCKETVDDEKTGFLVKVKDSDDLYEKMKIFAQLSQSEKNEIGKSARNKIEKEFDKKIVVKQTTDSIN